MRAYCYLLPVTGASFHVCVCVCVCRMVDSVHNVDAMTTKSDKLKLQILVLLYYTEAMT